MKRTFFVRRVFTLLALVALAAAGLTGLTMTPGSAAAENGKLSNRLARVVDAPSAAKSRSAQADAAGVPQTGAGSLLRRGTGSLLTYVRVSDTSAATLGSLTRAGADVVDVDGEYGVITAAVPVARLKTVSRVAAVRFVSEALAPRTVPPRVSTSLLKAKAKSQAAPVTTCGSVISEGDAILQTAATRSAFGVDGSGVKVGVLSDSFDTAATAPTHAAQDIASGDLPGPGNPCGRTTPVRVLHEYAAGDQTDEGRAMTQIVHDLAPGAELMFATAFDGEYAFARYIKELAAAGATVITDDVSYSNDPFYQRGPIGNAVRYVTARGVVYTSSAGNSNYILNGHDIGSYDTLRFRPTGCPAGIPNRAKVECHSFSPTGADPTNSYTVAPGGDLVGVYQSAQPRFGVTTDFDVYLLDRQTHSVLAVGDEDNIASGDPSEYVSWANDTTVNKTVDLVFVRFRGSRAPAMRIVFWDMYRIVAAERETGAGTDTVGKFETYGHSADPLAISTAATRWSDSSTPEYFSSRGPVRWLFAAVRGRTPSARLATPRIIHKPDVAATDGNLTTFFYGPGTPPPYRFYGTSAAAPHVAGVAALLRQLAPAASSETVRTTIADTAAPMAGGTVNSVGSGRVDAYAAAVAIAPSTVSAAVAGKR